MRALIVGDSREDLLNLRSLLGQVPEIEIIGEAHTLSAARTAAAETVPDVVFLDIELGPDNGFDLLEHLPDTTSQLDRSTLVRLDLVHSWPPFGAGLKLKFRNSPVELELGRAATKRFEEITA
jgi:DNA-binding LytR/AlgR family response regulator